MNVEVFEIEEMKNFLFYSCMKKKKEENRFFRDPKYTLCPWFPIISRTINIPNNKRKNKSII